MLQVIWLQRAVNDLAEIWSRGDSTLRQDVTRAANTIDQELHEVPFGSSESREGRRRVMFAAPLGFPSKSIRTAGWCRSHGSGESAHPEGDHNRLDSASPHPSFFITNINCFSRVLNPAGISPVGRA